MPRTRSLAWSELKVGVLTIVSIVIAAVLIFMLTGSTGFPWQRYSLRTKFPNVAGLNPGSPVRVAGVEVGSVEETILSGEEVEVVFELKTDYRERITTESRATLGTVSLLGESAVDITPSTKGTPIPDGGYVPSGPPAVALADITNDASKGLKEMTALIQDVRQGRGTVGKLMTDEALYAELNRLTRSAGDLTESLQQGRGTLGKLLNDPATANALESTMTNLESVTRRLNAGEGSLGKLLTDESFSRSLTSTTNSIDVLVAKLNKGEGTAGKLLNDTALYDRLNSMSQRLDQLIARLNDGEGTAGLLLKDKQLYENMNKTTTEAQGLIAQLKEFVSAMMKDPKKYLNVKISIF